jgi:hypothetical protein
VNATDPQPALTGGDEPAPVHPNALGAAGVLFSVSAVSSSWGLPLMIDNPSGAPVVLTPVSVSVGVSMSSMWICAGRQAPEADERLRDRLDTTLAVEGSRARRGHAALGAPGGSVGAEPARLRRRSQQRAASSSSDGDAQRRRLRPRGA